MLLLSISFKWSFGFDFLCFLLLFCITAHGFSIKVYCFLFELILFLYNFSLFLRLESLLFFLLVSWIKVFWLFFYLVNDTFFWTYNLVFFKLLLYFALYLVWTDTFDKFLHTFRSFTVLLSELILCMFGSF